MGKLKEGYPQKTAPVPADVLPIIDSENLGMGSSGSNAWITIAALATTLGIVAASFTAPGLVRKTYYNIADYGAVGDGYSSGVTYNGSATDNTAAIAACIAACAAGGGGSVIIPPYGYATDELTVPDSVSVYGISRKKSALILKAGSSSGQIMLSAGFGTGNAGTGSDDAFAGISYVNVENLTIDGNQVNQTATSGASDFRGNFALIKLYAWHLELRNIEFRNAKEVCLYTEHAANWEDSFNQYQFGESVFENLYGKNFGVVGWVNRGPHDSQLFNCYFSSYNAGGTDAQYGYVQEGNGNYGSSGMVVHGLHCWGQFSQNAVYVNGSNILEGFIYAEGATGSAIKLAGSVGSTFRATVGYCAAGIELDTACSNNAITASAQTNVTGGLFQLDGGAAGNALTHTAGAGNPGGAIFDLTTGAYTGGNNTFATSHPYAATLFAGTPSTSDKIDARSDNYPTTGAVTTWQLPVRDKALVISDASGSAQISAAGFGFAIGSTDTSSGATASTPSLTSGTAAQLSTASDVDFYVNVKVTSTVAVSMGPTSATADAIVASGTAAVGLMTIKVPKGWYVKVTFTSGDVGFLQVTC